MFNDWSIFKESLNLILKWNKFNMNISLDASPTTGKDLPSMMTPQKGSIVR